MPADQFSWGATKLPIIARHSDAKLRLLELYLARYFEVVVVNPRLDKLAISLVDGFSGGGLYMTAHGETRAGSPLVLLNAVRDAERKLNENRQKPLVIDAKFYFVELKTKSVAHLRQVLEASEFAPMLRDGRIVIERGEFETAFPKIIHDIKVRHRGGRSIFLLDQKGWNQVQFGTVRTILNELPRAEVILTFAVDWLVTYLNEGPEFALAMAKAGFEPAMVRRYVETKGEAGARFLIPRLLQSDILDLTGASYFTPFFLRSEQAKRDLWIIHLSKLTKARNVMVGAHWDIGNADTRSSIHQGEAGLDMLGFVPHWAETLPLDFEFDERASEAIRTGLQRDLPQEIFQLRDAPPTVDELIARVANQTAATEDHVQAVLRELHDAREIEIVTPSGNRKRGPRRAARDDRLIIPRQTHLRFGK